MDYRNLGHSAIRVSAFCLGTMSWGEQSTKQQAFAQADYASACGINFFDTAEMYPVPARREHYGKSEEILGDWMRSRKNRPQCVIASKVLGPSNRFGWARSDGRPTRLDRRSIIEACHNSLRRLQTDAIDLYQLHWPERVVNIFGRLGYRHAEQNDETPLAESIQTLAGLIEQGKIRQWGLSNETPWGVWQACALAEKNNWPRPVSIQNVYSLLNRSYEIGMAEISIRESVGLLAYSPLAGGALSGKYLNGKTPQGARQTLWPEYFRRYSSPHAEKTIGALLECAQRAGFDPVHLALAFVRQQRFVTSVIFGATRLSQLKHNIKAHALLIEDEELEKCLEAIHRRAAPCP